MANYYVNINNSYTYVVDGYYDWDQFLVLLEYSDLTSAVYNTTNNIFYVSGTRAIGDSVAKNINVRGSDIKILSIGKTPWVIETSAATLNLNYYGIVDNTDAYQNFSVSGAMLDANKIALKDLTTNQNLYAYYDNVWFHTRGVSADTSDPFEIHNTSRTDIMNSTIAMDNNGSRMVADNVVYDLYLNMYNTIYNGSYWRDNVSNISNIKLYFDALPSTDIDGLFLNKGDGVFTYDVVFYAGLSTNQYNFVSPSIMSSACTYLIDNMLTVLNYTNTEWVGALFSAGRSPSSYTTWPEPVYKRTSNFSWLSGRRDGIGALYFPKLVVDASATPLIGNIPFWVSASVEHTSANINASDVIYTWGDGAVSATSVLGVDGTPALSAEHTYTTPRLITLNISLISKNSWYNSSDTTNMVARDEIFSASFNIISASEVITSAYTYESITASASNISGTPTSYDFNFGTSSFAGLTNNNKDYFYTQLYNSATTYNNPVVTITMHNDAGQSATMSATFNSYKRDNYYYVDINDSHTISGNGSEISAFNYDTFLNIVNKNGWGAVQDSFKVKGYKEITSVGDIINVDSSKNFIIDSWNSTTHGPWMIVLNDANTYNTPTSAISFIGADIRNGIIYNKPRGVGSVYTGGRIDVAKIHNMYIVCQGINSVLGCGLYQTTSAYTSSVGVKTGLEETVGYMGTDIVGSTIYSQNGFNTLYTSGAITATDDNYLKITDSVITVDSYNTNYVNTTVSAHSYNSVYNFDYSAVSNLKQYANNQYNWSPPTNYPLTRLGDGYGETLDWVLLNKSTFKPFANITVPPNPGINYPYYPNYTSGMFGYYRAGYVRRF